MNGKYAFRFLMEPWDKPPAGESQQVRPGIRVSKDDYGYADDLIIGSIVRNAIGAESFAIFSTLGSPPPKEVLEKFRDQINHYLEHGHFT
jgi:hypothetical protein